MSAQVLPGRPSLATGLAAFVLGDADGRLTWVRETRGAPMDWGGIYAQGVRLTGPWTVSYGSSKGAVRRLTSDGPLVVRPGSFESTCSDGELQVRERLVVHPTEPRCYLTRILARRDGAADVVHLTSSFAPFLAPVLLEGLRSREFLLELQGPVLRWMSGGFVATLASDVPPTALRANGEPWDGRRRRSEIDRIDLVQEIAVPAGSEFCQRIVVSGGRKSGVPAGEFPGDCESWSDSAARAVETWEARSPSISLPTAPELSTAYGLARRALRTLYTAPEPEFCGLVAGLPWYAALWCRDLARMLPAVLWMGDADWAARSLDTVFRFQAAHRFPLLAAEPGELPMQVSPGPIFLFGTSDTSLYYPDLVRRYLRHTGDVERAAPWLPRLDGIRRWGEAKLDPGTGLFRNGGEIGELRTASAATGRVHLGIDAMDTTIWDSADRRDHANDLQFLWLETLRSLSELASVPGGSSDWATLRNQADALAAQLPARYRWSSEAYLYDSLHSDGTPVPRVRPNALQWVGSGLLDPAAERALVSRAGRSDLATDWGLRTLSSTDPEYDPESYHMGQVWPIATAWMAQAAFSIGEPDLGVEWLGRAAAQIVAEGGFANECYRGDRAEPFDSCFLLGFSVAPFLSVFFEGLWGLAPDAIHGVLGVDPRPPTGWTEMRLDGLSFRDGRVDLRVTPDRLTAAWSGPEPIVLAGPDRSVRIGAGEIGSLARTARKPS